MDSIIYISSSMDFSAALDSFLNFLKEALVFELTELATGDFSFSWIMQKVLLGPGYEVQPVMTR